MAEAPGCPTVAMIGLRTKTGYLQAMAPPSPIIKLPSTKSLNNDKVRVTDACRIRLHVHANHFGFFVYSGKKCQHNISYSYKVCVWICKMEVRLQKAPKNQEGTSIENFSKGEKIEDRQTQAVRRFWWTEEKRENEQDWERMLLPWSLLFSSWVLSPPFSLTFSRFHGRFLVSNGRVGGSHVYLYVQTTCHSRCLCI